MEKKAYKDDREKRLVTEKLEQLEGTELEGLVNEDQLPIVLDGSGGYFRFEFA